MKNVKTLNNKVEFIDEYLPMWRYEFAPDIVKTTQIFNLNVLISNTFQLNYTVLKHVSEEEVIDITEKLLKVFPVDDNVKFNEVISKCQFKSNTDNLIISDYALMEFENYYIVWHLDIYHKLGISINNIFRKEDLTLKKPLKNKIRLKEVA